jgi:cytoskeletal protein RodZ
MAEFQQDEGQGATIGERLRAAREEKGVSLDEVARQTRIPIRHLEHIERGEWDSLPAVTYSVGFARAYGKAVGLDGAQIGAELREQLGGSRTSSIAVAAYYEPADPARVPPRSIAIIALIIAALLVGGYLLWRSQSVDRDDPAEVAIVQNDSPAPAAAPAVQPGAAAPAPGANAPVVLTASEDVWMKIDQANGPSLFNGTLKAGQSYQVPPGAQAPKLRTGRANVLRVTVGGAPVAPLGPAETTISNVSLAAGDLAAGAQGAASAPPTAPAPAAAGR